MIFAKLFSDQLKVQMLEEKREVTMTFKFPILSITTFVKHSVQIQHLEQKFFKALKLEGYLFLLVYINADLMAK